MCKWSYFVLRGHFCRVLLPDEGRGSIRGKYGIICNYPQIYKKLRRPVLFYFENLRRPVLFYFENLRWPVLFCFLEPNQARWINSSWPRGSVRRGKSKATINRTPASPTISINANSGRIPTSICPMSPRPCRTFSTVLATWPVFDRKGTVVQSIALLYRTGVGRLRFWVRYIRDPVYPNTRLMYKTYCELFLRGTEILGVRYVREFPGITE